MGRQVLTGISPLVMEKSTCLPDYFNVTDEDVAGVLEGKTLNEEMAVNRKLFKALHIVPLFCSEKLYVSSVTNSKKKTKLAWVSYRTRAAMVPVLLYSKTKKMRQINTTPQHGFK